jgi:hypothetical protein
VGITLGSTGTDVSVTGSPITTSGNITINLPTASATNRGLLSSADWTTFNNKQAAGNYVTLDTAQTITGAKTFELTDLRLAAEGSVKETTITNVNSDFAVSTIRNYFGFNNANNIFFSSPGKQGAILSFDYTQQREYALPDADGTIALTSDIPSVTGFVTLATAQTITAQKTFSTSGGSDTAIINHGSGSGIALNITKAGNGEGLRVTKTSGSGNAMTVIGGILSTQGIFSTAPSDAIALKINGRSSDNVGQIRFGANTGGGQYNSIQASPSSFIVSSQGNTPLEFHTNVDGGGGPRMTIAGSGDVTLTGALNGASASFGGLLTINVPTDDTTVGIFHAGGGTPNRGLKISTFVSTNNNAGVRLDAQTLVGGARLALATAGVDRLTIDSTGAATFSESLAITKATSIFQLGNSTNNSYGAVQFLGNATGNGNTLGQLDFFNKVTGVNTVSAQIEVIHEGTSADNKSRMFFRAHNGTSLITPLTIASTGAATFSSSVTANGVMSLGNDGTFGSTYKTLGLTGNTTGSHRIFAGTTDDMYFAAATGKGFEFRANGGGVPNLYIASTGNVGIGTGSPGTPLHINANHVSGQSTLRIQSATAYSVGGLSSVGFNDSDGSRKALIYKDIVGLQLETNVALPIIFNTNGPERMRITSDGFARLSANSGGIQFNGDTAAANALDDYEEGTWTPTLLGSITNPSITYVSRIGSYTKVGRQVTCNFEIGTSSNIGGVGNIRISGLPFTVGIRSYIAVATYNIDNTATTPLSIFAEINASGTEMLLLQTADNATWANMDWSQATNSVIYVNATITYFV